MIYRLDGHDLKTAAEEMLITLFPAEKHSQAANGDTADVVSSVVQREKTAVARAEIFKDGRLYDGVRLVNTDGADARELKRLLSYAVKESIYRAARGFLHASPPWGSLTGVRPVKLASSAMDNGSDTHSAGLFLRERYHVSAKRAALASECAVKSRKAGSKMGKNDICLYISVPFCPTRCHYCSFVSHSIASAGHLVQPYVDAVAREASLYGEAAARLGLKVRAVYIGGGTPTSLSAEQIKSIMSAVSDSFDLSLAEEYTVEAGRPDTIDAEKLDIIRSLGADRISVNPQTMNINALKAAGRPHTPEDVIKAVRLAKCAGFDTVNMDLIAGLPEDSEEDFKNTLNTVMGLSPENITIHTLCYKRGADFSSDGDTRALAEKSGRDAGKMLEFAYGKLQQKGYSPYYLYRQKYMVGPYENTGWSIDGHESLYNIIMMEELGGVLAIGAGGVTKLRSGRGERLERLISPKYPYEYIAASERLDELRRRFTNFFEKGSHEENTDK